MKKSYLVLSFLIGFILITSARAQNTNSRQTQDNRPRSIVPATPMPAPSPIPVPPPRTDPNTPPATEAIQPPGAVIGNKPEPQPQLVSPTATERHADTAPVASLVVVAFRGPRSPGGSAAHVEVSSAAHGDEFAGNRPGDPHRARSDHFANSFGNVSTNRPS